MGVAKPVKLRNGLNFDKAGDAENFYQAILNTGDLRVALIGDEQEAVDALFRDYCAAEDWTMPGEPVEFHRDLNRAYQRTTKSFFVRYNSGEVDDFSYIKAIRAVVTLPPSFIQF
ncbi:MAG: DCL family protein [Alphaproteobacteria bacterium]|nr:DCL family protein [Alphaproteobacteria bacterium]MBU0833709.1 DCL family protein [Alphaproteobacteria bacterium]MBU1765951.1 DCL family protein [Alphaproteobacteria bacterium]